MSTALFVERVSGARRKDSCSDERCERCERPRANAHTAHDSNRSPRSRTEDSVKALTGWARCAARRAPHGHVSWLTDRSRGGKMSGGWDRVACLTLCVSAVSAMGCHGSEVSVSSNATTPEAGADDVSAPSDDGPALDASDDISAVDDVDASSDGRQSFDADVSDMNSVPDRKPVSDVRTTDGGSPGPIFYPTDVIHSPITASVADGLRRIASTIPTREPHNFLKAGDTIMGNAL